MWHWLTTFSVDDPSKSSTFKVIEVGGFNVMYEENTGSSGDYVSDTFTIGGATIKSLQMGLAYNTSIPTGIMGIGYDTGESPDANSDTDLPPVYPNLIDDMVSQGLIPTKAYSLYLDDLEASTGS